MRAGNRQGGGLTAYTEARRGTAAIVRTHLSIFALVREFLASESQNPTWMTLGAIFVYCGCMTNHSCKRQHKSLI